MRSRRTNRRNRLRIDRLWRCRFAFVGKAVATLIKTHDKPIAAHWFEQLPDALPGALQHVSSLDSRPFTRANDTPQQRYIVFAPLLFDM
jgi:hypothetical protein